MYIYDTNFTNPTFYLKFYVITNQGPIIGWLSFFVDQNVECDTGGVIFCLLDHTEEVVMVQSSWVTAGSTAGRMIKKLGVNRHFSYCFRLVQLWQSKSSQRGILWFPQEQYWQCLLKLEWSYSMCLLTCSNLARYFSENPSIDKGSCWMSASFKDCTDQGNCLRVFS